MKTSVVFTVLATWAAIATASLQPAEKDSTTTMTSTVTMTYTITECAPEVPDCPANRPPPSTPTPETPYEPEPTPYTSSSIYNAPEDTASYSAPTVDYSSKPPTLNTQTSVADAPAPSSKPVVTAGASRVFLSNGIVLGVLAVGVALLA